MDAISAGRAGVELVKNLIPPHEGDERVYRWRVFVAVFSGVNALATIGHIMWACGWLSFVGLNGFVLKDAYAEDIRLVDQRRNEIDRKVDIVQKVTITSAIRETMKNRCVAKAQNNQAALDSANKELELYEQQYYDVFHRPYIEQDCSVVLIAKIP